MYVSGGLKGEVVAVEMVVGGFPEKRHDVYIRRKGGKNYKMEHDYIKMEKNKGRDKQKLRSTMYS